ncbi:hypothetical protein THIOKS1270011 [Thiocapsa sp. KS1]|nr:hypothetical protein THIOKS1270011 [Thiocapsa sp. KS1]
MNGQILPHPTLLLDSLQYGNRPEVRLMPPSMSHALLVIHLNHGAHSLHDGGRCGRGVQDE